MWWVITTRIGDVRFCFVCFVVVNILLCREDIPRGLCGFSGGEEVCQDECSSCHCWYLCSAGL